MSSKLRTNISNPSWWLWGSAGEAPVITGRTIILAGLVLAVGIILLFTSLFSGTPVKRPLLYTQNTLPSSAPAQSTSPTNQATSPNPIQGSSTTTSPQPAIPAVVQQIASQGAAAEVDGEWAGVATAPGTPLTAPVGQVGQPTTVQSLSLDPNVQSGQLQGAEGTATVDQGSTSYVVEVNVQLYNSQWVFIPQQGGVAQTPGG